MFDALLLSSTPSGERIATAFTEQMAHNAQAQRLLSALSDTAMARQEATNQDCTTAEHAHR
jgi:hypothetical protein